MSELLPRSFVSSDIPAALDLWRNTPGIGLGLSDNPDDLIQFLQRNPGLSRVVSEQDKIIGTALSGHDGRRGFLYHIAVAENFQNQGIGRALVADCVQQLERCGILRTTIHIFSDNELGIRFWQSLGWHIRKDLAVMQVQA